jgi:hypothetical protein
MKLYSLTPFYNFGRLWKPLNALTRNGILEGGRRKASRRRQAALRGRGIPMVSPKPASNKLRCTGRN